MKYIIDSAIETERWKRVGYSLLTPFLHARENGYKNFWNIDADDTGLYAKRRKIAKILKNVKEYVTVNKIDMISLDMCRTRYMGSHWTFGITYTDNNINWLDLMKSHCKDKFFLDKNCKYWNINIDGYCAYLGYSGVVNLSTFYVENLRMIHHTDDVYRNPGWAALRYWENGKYYSSVLKNDFGMSEAGSLPIYKDIINFDIGITAEESKSYLKNQSTDVNVKTFEIANGVKDSEISIILPLDETKKCIRDCLESILYQTFNEKQNWGRLAVFGYIDSDIFKNCRLIVTDAGLNETALKTCREFESKFEGRMKIITGLKAENLLSAGLQASKGRYIMFINGNEIFIPQAFQFLYEVIENYRADVVHTSNYFVPEGDTAIVKTDEVGWRDDQSFTNLRRVNEKIVAWSEGMLTPLIFNKLIRREFLEEEKISLPFADDMTQWIFSLQCLMLAENYVRVPQPFYVRTSTPTPPNVIKDFSTRIKSLAKCYEALDKLDEEVFYFDEYADEKNLIKNILNKNFVNEV